MTIEIDAALIQGSDDWLNARIGSLGASRVHEVIARTKTGWSSSRANLKAELVCEKLTGVPAEAFVSQAMKRGSETEAQALANYAFISDVEVMPIGLVRHPTIQGTHSSPDGMVNDDGMVEAKCPGTPAHIELLRGSIIPIRYRTQMTWQLACCPDREWNDFVSFDPRLPVNAQIYLKRTHRDAKAIAELENQVREFMAEVEEEVEFIRRYGESSSLRAALEASVAA